MLYGKSAGGIEAYTGDGKIKIVNTLEARLDMLFSQVNHFNEFIKLKIKLNV